MLEKVPSDVIHYHKIKETQNHQVLMGLQSLIIIFFILIHSRWVERKFALQ